MIVRFDGEVCMRRARVWLVGLVLGVLLAGAVPAAAQAAFGVEGFTAVNCRFGHEGCAGFNVASGFEAPYWFPKEPTEAEAKAQGFVQAGGRVPYGVTDFKVNTTGAYPNAIPDGAPVKKVRVDVASGLATAPAAVPGNGEPACSMEEFGATEAIPGTGLYLEPECESDTEIGVEYVTVYSKELEEGIGVGDLPLQGTVYNLVQPTGLASYYGAAVKFPKALSEAKGLGKTQFYLHSFVKGNVEWGKEAEGTSAGDFHDYFTVEVSPVDPLVSSRQVLFGTSGERENFITNGTACPGDHTTFVTLENTAKEVTRKAYTTPIGLKGCDVEHENLEGISEITQVPFSPGFKLSSATSVTEQPNEFTAEATSPDEGEEVAQSQVKSAAIVLPEGMTLNPSAANGLTACTEAQAHQEGTVFGPQFGVECPASSKIGTVALNVPTLPDGSFTGDVYLGAPNSGTITGPPFKVYVVANSARYGVSVRLLGETETNEITGQVTTRFKNPPEQPFTSLVIHFARGVLAPVANPLLCGNYEGATSFEPTIKPGTSAVDKFGLTVTGCSATPPPFSPGQSTSVSTTAAGGHPSFTLNLARTDGTQYLSAVRTELPPGLIGQLSKAEECSAGVAESETAACPAGSKIGVATVLAGSGSSPFTFTGSVYLTNAIQGAPYGMSVKVPAVAGPFNFGTVVTIGKITVNPYTAQVIVESTLPRIRRGVPLRIRNISVAINKSGFMLNPTNCNPAATVSSLKGYALLGEAGSASATLSSPFQATGCNSLKFSPKFSASSSTKVSRANGAMLDTTVTQGGGQSNIKYVKVQLPKQLPSRQSTLKQACLEKVFAADPFRCGAGSFVGGARVESPALPRPLTGPAILVSHAGASFPDLDLVVEDPNHLRVILVGNTNITKGITTTTFASNPDAPISKVTVNLPTGSHSALGAYGALCKKPLVEPTTIKAQNGKTIKQNTIINVAGCGVQIVGNKTVGDTLYLTVRAPAAGRISASGPNLVTVVKHTSKAFQNVSMKVPLSSTGRRRFKPLTVTLRVGFVPKKGHSSSVHQRVTFR